MSVLQAAKDGMRLPNCHCETQAEAKGSSNDGTGSCTSKPNASSIPA